MILDSIPVIRYTAGGNEQTKGGIVKKRKTRKAKVYGVVRNENGNRELVAFSKYHPAIREKRPTRRETEAPENPRDFLDCL